jgi:hypothetical protein
MEGRLEEELLDKLLGERCKTEDEDRYVACLLRRCDEEVCLSMDKVGRAAS